MLEGTIPSVDHSEMVIIVFCVQHLVLLFKIILAEVIEDEPEWVQEDMETVENRVTQTQSSIDDKKLWERLSDHFEPYDLLINDVLKNLHKDRDIAALLVPKLKKGCIDFLKKQTSVEKTGEKLRDKEGETSPGRYVLEDDDFKHVSREIQKEKLTNIVAQF